MAEDESRAVTVRNLIKLAKDFARKPLDKKERIEFMYLVRENMQKYMPVGIKQLGLKRWWRLQLLKASPALFVRIV